MGSFQKFKYWMVARGDKPISETKASNPNYSFDRWLKSATDTGNQIDSLVGQAKDQESKLDKEKSDKEKDLDKLDKEQPKLDLDKDKNKPDNKPHGNSEDDSQDDHKDAWKALRNISKERKIAFDKEQMKKDDKGKE